MPQKKVVEQRPGEGRSGESAASPAQGSSAEELWQSLFESSPDIIFTVDSAGTITSLNRAAPGLEAAELLGRSVFELAPAADRDAVRALLERVGATGASETYEGRWIGPDGRTFHFESRCVPVKRGGADVVSFLIVTRDVTARHRAQAALAASEERFRALIENSADAICLFDAKGIIAYANPATKRVLDYEPGALSGIDGWQVIHPDDRPALQEFMQRLLQNPAKPLAAAPYRLRHRNGTWRWVETHATNLLGLGSVRAILANYRDITERVELEEQLRQSQKMEAIGLLAGGVAHDFNNLLTVILGFADHVAGALPKHHAAATDLEYVRKAAESGAELTRKLLSFARRQIRMPAPFDLGSSVRSFGELVRRMVGEDVAVSIDVPDLPLPIDGDEGQIQQLLLNLVTNARQAMPSGGQLGLAVRRLVGKTDGKKDGSPDRCELVVSDTGVGMDARTRERVFEPFFTTRPGGTGLGMSVVFGVVQDHQGAINVESAPGHGTTVRVELPLSELPARRPVAAAPLALSGRETVLLAEDEPLVRELMAGALRRFGYNVLAAGDGEEALAAFEANADRVDIVVLDVIMPKLGGWPAFAEMRGRRPALKAVFMSGYLADAPGVAELASRGQAALLNKPFLATELAARIRELLDS